MARKHFDKYLADLGRQYLDLLDGLHEFEDYVNSNIVDTEQLENFKNTIKPVSDAYNSMMYVKYLLDMPNRDKKASRYKQQQLSLYEGIDPDRLGSEIIKQNKLILASLKKGINS